jgi:hypothetical protein
MLQLHSLTWGTNRHYTTCIMTDPVDQDIVKVGSVSGKIEAEIIRGMLEANGISVLLVHEAAATIYGLGVGPLAMVDLMVPADQAKQATEILESYRAGIAGEDD